MAKRFTDTEIWAKSWYTELSAKHKLLTRFIWDNCNQIGLWPCNWPLASFMIGEQVGPDDLPLIDGGKQFEMLEPGKLFVPGFCSFQYGELNPSSPPHKRYIKMLQQADLFDRVSLGYSKGINTLTDNNNSVKNISITPEDKGEDKEEEENFYTKLIKSAAKNNNFVQLASLFDKLDVILLKKTRKKFDGLANQLEPNTVEPGAKFDKTFAGGSSDVAKKTLHLTNLLAEKTNIYD